MRLTMFLRNHPLCHVCPGWLFQSVLALWIGGLAACGSDGAGSEESDPPEPATRTFDIVVEEGEYALKEYGLGGMDHMMVFGRVDALLSNGQFLAPTLVARLGDRLEVRVENRTGDWISFHPHGVRYTPANEGVGRHSQVEPGGSFTYQWDAVEGTGVFPYHSHILNETGEEEQAMRGLLGALVILDGEDAAGTMINYFLMDTASGYTHMEEMEGMEDGEMHNHTLAAQQVTPDGAGSWETRTVDSLEIRQPLGAQVRFNLFGFGNNFHTFHTHGFSWQDPATGTTLDTRTIGPAESYTFQKKLDNPGRWMVHCHVDQHMPMMTTFLEIK